MRLQPHPVTLRQLQYLVAVAERQSFRKAAEDCRVSQPSLSAQVAQAEEALGVQLFERDQRSVALTPAGKLLVEQIRRLLESADALVDAAKQLSDPFSGTLRIGVIPTIAPYLLPDFAPVLREKYPKITFVWIEEKTPVLVDRLSRAELDGAVLALEADIAELPHVVIGTDPFVFAARPEHPLAASKRAVKTDELEGEPVLLLDDGHCFRDQALAYCARAGASEAAFRATSLSTLVQMTAGGLGVTILPSLALTVENRRGELVTRPFAPKAPSRTLALVWRKQSAHEVALKAIGQALAKAYDVVKKSA
ncbi:LysR substrate-binding domain-containing protein [Myxococcota bacterium]|nr:LysR substrate-binding domain-containing protein [Myxococcota bacterium]